uniref:Putative plastid division protein n=1 Tax=Micractinium pusillum TaxID=126839 RepID=A0A650F3J2_9CHLO|nr:putative plastid division protein [Micractinium pusillum]
MRIENNTKKPLEERKSVSGEHKTLMFQIRQWVLSHRLNSRQKLLSKPINLATVLTFLPLALGFSQFIINKARSSQNFDKSYSFFEKNMPVFTQFKPKLNFETFEYISKSNSRASVKSTQTNLMFGQSNFGGTIFKKNDIFGAKSHSFRNTKFNGLSCDFYLLTSGNFLSKTSSILALNLDDLPSYLQGLNPTLTLSTGNPESNSKNLIDDEIKKSRDNNLLFSNFKIENLKPKKRNTPNSRDHCKPIYFCSADFPTKLPLINGLQHTFPKTLSSELFIQSNQFHNDRLEFYHNRTQFNHELQTIFTKKNISSTDLRQNSPEQNRIQNEVSDSNEFSYFNQVFDLDQLSALNPNLKWTAEHLVEAILQELAKTSISKDLPNSRLMSGYNYPDMSSEELGWFYLATPTLNALKLGQKGNEFGMETRPFLPKIEGPIASSKEYPFHVKNFPEFSIKIKQVSLLNPKSNKSFSTGPGVLLDSQRALDWKTSSQQNVRSWFHRYLSPLNPLMQPLDNFFGVYYSPQLLQNSQIPEFSGFANKPLFYSKSTASLPLVRSFSVFEESPVRFSPSRLSFNFPVVREEGKAQFLRTLDLRVAKNKDTNQFVTVPILQLHQPLSSLASSQSKELLDYSPYFTFTGKGNPDYLFSIDFFATKNYVTKYASGSYTKTASVYSKSKSSAYRKVDNWEPLTATWWLIITQFSFAVFSFNVLKGLIDNYGRELLGYLLEFAASLGILDDSLKEEIELLTGQRDKGFRVVLKSRKTFKDVVGVEKILPEIYEVVWFLRNSARDFVLSKTLPRGILLTGPPGTGKTLLVQALAGETQVPVVVLSGSSLIEPGESCASKLEMVFQEARELAPCIVFIDEIDTLGPKRSGIVQNPMGSDELVESLTLFQKPLDGSVFEKLELARKKAEIEKDRDANIQMQNSSQQEQLSLLTQLLIELDGMQGRDGIIVIGATNRPEMLDPALLRPGRLEKIIQVGLPGPEKRVEILKLYGQGLGYQANIPWNYLGDRTAGFTAADLATLMNESTIKAILTQTKHTVETIEHGIDRLTTSESEKYTVFKTQSAVSAGKASSLTVASKMAILRLAYYQAGKIVLSAFLETHPKSVFASLWPRRTTIRSAQIATNLQNSEFEFARLCEITDRLVGCYAGKAAEILFVQQFSSSCAQLSTIGLEDLLFAQKLIYCILEKWSFYSKKSHIQQTTHLKENVNVREFREIPEKLDFYAGVVETIQIPPMSKALEADTSSLESKKKSGVTDWNAQMFYSIPWWQQEVSSELEFGEKNFQNWSRFYLYNPEQNERNPEWFPPDEFYHSSSSLKNVKKAFANIAKTEFRREKTLDLEQRTSVRSEYLPVPDFSDRTGAIVKKWVPTRVLVGPRIQERSLPEKAYFPWNEVSALTRDYPAHSLVLQSFNKALVILNQNRELLDRIVVELLYHEILRQPEIEKLLHEFQSSKSTSQEEFTVDLSFQIDEFEKEKKEKFEIIETSWGLQSRKPMPRWINFAEFSEETT